MAAIQGPLPETRLAACAPWLSRIGWCWHDSSSLAKHESVSYFVRGASGNDATSGTSTITTSPALRLIA